jgi:hypothetical protein
VVSHSYCSLVSSDTLPTEIGSIIPWKDVPVYIRFSTFVFRFTWTGFPYWLNSATECYDQHLRDYYIVTTPPLSLRLRHVMLAVGEGCRCCDWKDAWCGCCARGSHYLEYNGVETFYVIERIILYLSSVTCKFLDQNVDFLANQHSLLITCPHLLAYPILLSVCRWENLTERQC